MESQSKHRPWFGTVGSLGIMVLQFIDLACLFTAFTFDKSDHRDTEYSLIPRFLGPGYFLAWVILGLDRSWENWEAMVSPYLQRFGLSTTTGRPSGTTILQVVRTALFEIYLLVVLSWVGWITIFKEKDDEFILRTLLCLLRLDGILRIPLVSPISSVIFPLTLSSFGFLVYAIHSVTSQPRNSLETFCSILTIISLLFLSILTGLTWRGFIDYPMDGRVLYWATILFQTLFYSGWEFCDRVVEGEFFRPLWPKTAYKLFDWDQILALSLVIVLLIGNWASRPVNVETPRSWGTADEKSDLLILSEEP